MPELPQVSCIRTATNATAIPVIPTILLGPMMKKYTAPAIPVAVDTSKEYWQLTICFKIFRPFLNVWTGVIRRETILSWFMCTIDGPPSFGAH